MNRKSLLKKIIWIVLIWFVFSWFSFAFDCSTHTNWDSGDITYSGSTTSYDSVYCLDSSDLTWTYETLHTTWNYSSWVAFVISEDLNFSWVNLDYATLNENLGFGTGNDTWLPIGWRGTFSAAWLTNFNADFYGSGNTIKVGNIDYSNDSEVGFFGYIDSQWVVYELNLEIGDISGDDWVWWFLWFNDGWTIENSSIVVNSVSWNEDRVWWFIWHNNNWIIKNSSAVVNNVSWGNNRVWWFVWNIYSWTIENSSVVGGNVNWSGDNVWWFVWRIWDNWTIKNSSVIVSLVNWNNKVWWFVWHNDDWTIENSSVVLYSINWNSSIWWFVWYNRPWTIKNSSVVVNLISWNNNVWWFVWNDYNPTYSWDVSRVLDLSWSSDVARDFYTKGGGTKDTYNKEEFFFNDTARDNDGLSTVVGSGDITITVPKNIQYSDTSLYSWWLEDKVDEFKGNFYDKYEVTFSETKWLSWVNIEVNEENLTTNSSWETTIQLKDGNYNFTWTKDGYQTYTTGFEVNGTWKTVEFEMEKVIGAQFDCTSENSWTYSGTNYDTIFCLDSSDLTWAYNTLHTIWYYDNTIAFVLSWDLNFSGVNLDYATLNENLGFGIWNDTWLPIWGSSDFSSPVGWSTNFSADFYGNEHTIKLNDIDYSDSDDELVEFFGFIDSECAIYDLNLEINNVIWYEKVWWFVWKNQNWAIKNSSAVVNSVVWSGDNRVWWLVWRNNWMIDDTSLVITSVSGNWNMGIGWLVWNNYGWTVKNSWLIVNSVFWTGNNIWWFVWMNNRNWQIEKSSVVVDRINWTNQIWWFVWMNWDSIIIDSSVVSDSVSGNNLWWFVWINYHWTINSWSAVVNLISWNNVWWFVWGDSSWTYSGDVARVLDLDGISDISRDFYTKGWATENTYDKEDFFFNDTARNNDWLSTVVGSGKTEITVPEDKRYSSIRLYSWGIEDKVDEFKGKFYDPEYNIIFSETNWLSGVNIEVDGNTIITSSNWKTTAQLKDGSYNFTWNKERYKTYATGFDVSGTWKILEFEMQKSPEFCFTISDQILKADEEQKTIPLNAKLILNWKEIEWTEYSYEVYSWDSIKDNLKIENKQLVITGLNQTWSYDIAIQVTWTASNIQSSLIHRFGVIKKGSEKKYWTLIEPELKINNQDKNISIDKEPKIISLDGKSKVLDDNFDGTINYDYEIIEWKKAAEINDNNELIINPEIPGSYSVIIKITATADESEKTSITKFEVTKQKPKQPQSDCEIDITSFSWGSITITNYGSWYSTGLNYQVNVSGDNCDKSSGDEKHYYNIIDNQANAKISWDNLNLSGKNYWNVKIVLNVYLSGASDFHTWTFTVNSQNVKDVETTINNLPDPESVIESDKQDINDANEAYDNLEPSEKDYLDDNKRDKLNKLVKKIGRILEEVDNNTDTNAKGKNLATSVSSTDEINQGKDVTIRMIIEDEENNSQDGKLIQNYFDDYEDFKKWPMYGIKLMKIIEDETWMTSKYLRETEASVTVILELPESYQVKDDYNIVHVHTDENGNKQIDELEVKYDKQNHELTFKTDKFSTFSVGYEENSHSGGGSNQTSSWWGWGWWEIIIPTCKVKDLVCKQGRYYRKESVSCKNWLLGESCTKKWVSELKELDKIENETSFEKVDLGRFEGQINKVKKQINLTEVEFDIPEFQQEKVQNTIKLLNQKMIKELENKRISWPDLEKFVNNYNNLLAVIKIKKDWEITDKIMEKWKKYLGNILEILDSYQEVKTSDKINDKEFANAWAFMKRYNLTEYDSVDDFRPYDELKRQEAARFFWRYFSNIMWLQEKEECSFDDIQKADQKYKEDIRLACKIWIMWNKIEDFRPLEKLTRAQSFAVIIRALVGKYLDESIKPWWNRYFEAARRFWLTNETNLIKQDRSIKRYQVALILYRLWNND